MLELDLRERPDDTYLLFNLGTAYVELGRTAEAQSELETHSRLVKAQDGAR